MTQPEGERPASDFIDNFLQQASSTGHRDSDGVFTIDIKVAERKLAAFALPSPESWILVLVQAAHRGEATEIKVTQLARQSTVTISGARPWTWSDLQAVRNGASTTDGALLAYAVVVRALIGHGRLTSFRVKAPDGTSALWRGDQFRIERDRIEDSLLSNKTVFEVSHLGSFPKKSSFLFEVRRNAREELAALQQALVRSCFVSSVPITVDGLRISGLHLGETLPPYHKRVPLALLPVGDYRIPSSPLSAALRSTQAELPSQADISASSRDLDSQDAAGALACLFLVQKQERRFFQKGPQELSLGQSRLLWIQDGVVVGSHNLTIPGHMELTLLISAAGLQTDLSGLELVQNSELTLRKQLAVDLACMKFRELSVAGQTKGLEFFGPTAEAPRGIDFGRWLGKLTERENLELSDDDLEILQRDLQLLPERLVGALG